MKIYQIHEYGGEWEDKFDWIVSSYLSEEKAIAEMKCLEVDEKNIRESYDRCRRCPLYVYSKYWSEDDIEMYCDRYEPFDQNKHNPDEYGDDEKCVNVYWCHEDSYYRIEEVEVIE